VTGSTDARSEQAAISLQAGCQPTVSARAQSRDQQRTATYQDGRVLEARGPVRGARCRRLETTPTATWRDPNRGRRPACGSPMPWASGKPGTHPHAGWMCRIIGRQARVCGSGCSPSSSRSSWCLVQCWPVLRSLPQLPVSGVVLIGRRSGGIRTGPSPRWCSVQPGRRRTLAPARSTPPRAVTRPLRPSPHATKSRLRVARSRLRVARSHRRVARSGRPVGRSSPQAVRSSLRAAQ
jgi:hypothetical protein